MTAGRVSAGHPVDVSSGEMFDIWEDAYLPGAKSLIFTRKYSVAALGRAPTAFGKGWTSNCFASLRKEGDTYIHATGDGSEVRFPDPGGAVWAGRPVRNFGAFSELIREGGLLTVVTWDPTGHSSERFHFVPGDAGKAWPLKSHLDASGNALDYAWDGGRLQSVRQRRERRGIQLRYNHLGLISELELQGDNARRLQCRYFYDPAGRMIRTENCGVIETFDYDDKDRMVRTTTRTGGEFTFTYDDQDRCIRSVGKDRFFDRVFRYLPHLGWTEVTDSLGNVWRYEHLPSGQVVKTLSPMGVETATEYDAEGRIIALIDGNGARTERAYSDAGDLASVTNALGEVTRFEHNARHQLTVMIDSLGQTWTLEYDAAGRMTAAIDALGAKWTCESDPTGAPKVIRTPLGHERRFAYDANGNVAQWTDWEGGVIAYAYDGLGRILSRTDPLGRATRFAWDDKDQVTSVRYPDGSTRTYEYDAAGNLVARTDESGKVTRFKWATCGRLVKSVDPAGGSRKYWWSTEPDRVIKVVDEKGREYRFEYDADGRPVKEIDFEGRPFEREFDNAMNMVLTRDAAGRETVREYDACHRVTKRVAPDGAETVFTFGPRGMMLSAANPSATVEFAYDPIGRLLKEESGGIAVESEYDAVHNRIGVKSSLGHAARFGWNGNKDLVSLGLDGKWDFAFGRDAAGREVRRDLPGGGVLSQAFDLRDRMVSQSVEHAKRGADLPVAGGESESYVLGPTQAAMRILRTFIHSPDELSYVIQDAHRGETRFGYDRAGRLTSAVRSSGRREQFDYDEAGNPLRFIRLPGPRDGHGPEHGEQDCEYGPGNLLIRKGATRFEYDPAGRMVRRVGPGPGGTDAVWEYHWNGDDLLERVVRPDGAAWRYAYDAFGRRISKQGPDGAVTRFVWDGDTLLHDLSPDGKIRTWTFDDQVRPLALIDQGGVGAIINDPGGLPQEVLREDGTVAWAAAWSSWGLLDASLAKGMDMPVRYPGQWFDAETGLHWNRFRMYDPTLGRYLTPDPLRTGGGLHAYQYAPSSTHWQDPFGLTTTVVPGAKRGQEFEQTRDSQGRITKMSGPLADPAKLPKDRRLRDEYAQRTLPDKTPGDDAGHLIGDQFGGPGGHDNLVSMCSDMNQNGSWAKMEDQLVTITGKRGNKVEVTVHVHYDGDDTRPSKFTVIAKITDKNGKETTRRWLHTNC